MLLRIRRFGTGIASIGALALTMSGGAPAVAGMMFVPLAVEAPESPVTSQAAPACTSPNPVHTSAEFHCYTPSDIAAAYGVDKLHAAGDMGQGQTIVLVDSFGSPTAAND